jgi:hypothetical protein
MTTHQSLSLSSSSQIYAQLLSLYPKEHRTEYGPSMLQNFKDQYRSALQSKGRGGVVLLWQNTLKDLIVSVWKEHISSPNFSLGLLESVPNTPLSWKGVALVLIPGLVFIIGQIGVYLGEELWMHILCYWATVALIIPVLLVWWRTRIFPIWGLIPLGLFLRTVMAFGYHLVSSEWTFAEMAIPFWEQLKVWAWIHQAGIKIFIVFAMVGLIAWLIIWGVRRRFIPRIAWGFMGMIGMVFSINLLAVFLIYLRLVDWNISELIGPNAMAFLGQSFSSAVYFEFYFAAGFFLVVLLGALSGRRHGFLAILLVLGYLLPAILFGQSRSIWPDQPTLNLWFDPTTITYGHSPNLLLINSVMMTYRLLLAVVAPVMIVRAASVLSQKRIGLFALLAAAGIHIAMIFSILFFNGGSGMAWFDYYYIGSAQLIAVAGILLALSLYGTARPIPKRTAVPGATIHSLA